MPLRLWHLRLENTWTVFTLWQKSYLYLELKLNLMSVLIHLQDISIRNPLAVFFIAASGFWWIKNYTLIFVHFSYCSIWKYVNFTDLRDGLTQTRNAWERYPQKPLARPVTLATQKIKTLLWIFLSRPHWCIHSCPLSSVTLSGFQLICSTSHISLLDCIWYNLECV
jgi:hypothetical protein